MPQESGTQADGKAQAIRNELDADLVESADEAGIEVDPIIQQNVASRGKYGANVIKNFVETDIRNAIESENAETLRGLVAGSRDRKDSKGPRRFSLVRSSGEHVEVNTWDGSLPGPNGGEVEIPNGAAKVEFECDYEEQYDSFQAVALGGVESIEVPTMVDLLSKVAISPDEIGRNDQYEIVVVEGTISYIDTQSIFAQNSDGDWEVDREGEILMEDSRGGLKPHLEISLAKEGDTSLRTHVEMQGYGDPYFAVPDFLELIHDAYETYDDPEAQAKFVRNGMQGTDVVVVGNVNSFNTSRNDGEVTNYVDMAASAIVSPEVTPDTATDSAGETEEAAEDETEEAADEADEEPEGDESADEDTPAVEDIREQIEQYAQLVGEDIEDLTAKDIVENAGGIEAPESVIDHALNMGDGADEDDGGEEESGNDGRESLEQRFSGLKKSGMFQCPGDDCPGKGSSVADLIAHVAGEHDVDGAGEAKDWLAEQV